MTLCAKQSIGALWRRGASGTAAQRAAPSPCWRGAFTAPRRHNLGTIGTLFKQYRVIGTQSLTLLMENFQFLSKSLLAFRWTLHLRTFICRRGPYNACAVWHCRCCRFQQLCNCLNESSILDFQSVRDFNLKNKQKSKVTEKKEGRLNCDNNRRVE